MTDEELLAMSARNPGYQFERNAKGELIVTPTGLEWGGRSAEVLRQLGNWAAAEGTGVVFDSSTGFRLPDGSLLSPDASWARRARIDALTPEQRKRFGPLCPDAVFEIRSESDTMADLREKMAAYLANGAALGVLVDPLDRIVEVYRPGRPPARDTNSATLALDPELRGFVLDLRRIL